MVEIGGGGGVSFPVVFFDGERESQIGSVTVYPSMEFKRFQTLLSQKIGISPHQFSVHLSSPESRRRIPITGKVNFGAISREKNCFFVVVLKRSRRERRRKNHHHHRHDFHYDDDDLVLYSKANAAAAATDRPPMGRNLPPNVMLLRRDAGIDLGHRHDQSLSPFSDRIGYEERVLNLQLERERYLMNMGLSGLGPEPNEAGAAVGRSDVVVCEDCVRAKESGEEVGFHWCVYDAVTFGFRSPVGPIARPSKASE